MDSGSAANTIGGKRIEYSVRAVTRYIINRYDEDGTTAGSSGRGEFENPNTAYEVAYALCKQEHDRLGYPIDDPRVKYPEMPGVRNHPDGSDVISEKVRKRIAVELDRVHGAHGDWLRHHDGDPHKGLDAAQQALCWVVEPTLSASPFDMISRYEGWVSFGQDRCGLGKPKPPSEPPVNAAA